MDRGRVGSQTSPPAATCGSAGGKCRSRAPPGRRPTLVRRLVSTAPTVAQRQSRRPRRRPGSAEEVTHAPRRALREVLAVRPARDEGAPASDGSLARSKRRSRPGASSNPLIRPAGTFSVRLPESVEHAMPPICRSTRSTRRSRSTDEGAIRGIDRDRRSAEPRPDDRDRRFALTPVEASRARPASPAGVRHRDDAAKLVVAELVPGDRGHERLPAERLEHELPSSGHRRRPPAVEDQRELAEDVGGAELTEHLAVAADRRPRPSWIT